MNMHRKYVVLVFILAAFAGGAGFLYLAIDTADPSPSHATVLPQPMALPEFALRDEKDQPFDRASLFGQWSLVFFGFTHCPDICPATLQQLSLARERMIADGTESIPQIVLVSVDPERDTPDVIREYTGHFGSGIKGVSGEIDELRKLTAATGVYFAKSGLPGGGYTVDHSTVVLLVNPGAQFHAVFSAPYSVDHFVNDVPLIADAS